MAAESIACPAAVPPRLAAHASFSQAAQSKAEPGGSIQALVKARIGDTEYRNEKSLEKKSELYRRKLISGANKAQHTPSHRASFLPGSTEGKQMGVLCCRPQAGDSSQAFKEGTDSPVMSSWRNIGKTKPATAAEVMHF